MNRMERTICIDFGISNSSVVYVRSGEIRRLESLEQGSYLFPSYVMYQGGRVIVGEAARRQLGVNNRFVVSAVKRLLGVTYDEYLCFNDYNAFGCTVVRGDDALPYLVIDEQGTRKSPVEVAGELFKTIKKAADLKLGSVYFRDPVKAEFAYVTVPADYTMKRLQAIKEAAALAGLKITKFIHEPTAAALSWCLSNEKYLREGEKFLIYDFGRLELNVSCIECTGDYHFTVLGTECDKMLGGDIIDSSLVEVVIQYMKDNDIPILNRLTHSTAYDRGALRLRKACEEQKRHLINSATYAQEKSEYDQKNQKVVMEIDFSHMKPLDADDDEEDDDDDDDDNTMYNLTLSAFDNTVKPLINKSIECVKRLLRSLRLRPDDIKCVFLVGGTSKIHQIKRRLVDMFPYSLFPDVDEELCVANGAAQRLVCEHDPRARVRVRDLLRCSYGIIDSDGVVLMVLKGESIPTTSIPLHLGLKSGEEYIITTIYKYDGDVEQFRNIKHPTVNKVDCKKVHIVKIRNPRPVSSGIQKFEFKLHVHEDGTLELTCMDMDTGRMLESSIYDKPMVVYSCLLSQSDGNTAHFFNETPLSPRNRLETSDLTRHSCQARTDSGSGAIMTAIRAKTTPIRKSRRKKPLRRRRRSRSTWWSPKAIARKRREW